MRRNRVKNGARCTAFPEEMRRFGAGKAVMRYTGSSTSALSRMRFLVEVSDDKES
jgi:hypothetical protein